MTTIKKGRIQGIAYAIAFLLRAYKYTEAIDMWNDWGMTYEDCRTAEVDDFDMGIIETNLDVLTDD